MTTCPKNRHAAIFIAGCDVLDTRFSEGTLDDIHGVTGSSSEAQLRKALGLPARERRPGQVRQ